MRGRASYPACLQRHPGRSEAESRDPGAERSPLGPGSAWRPSGMTGLVLKTERDPSSDRSPTGHLWAPGARPASGRRRSAPWPGRRCRGQRPRRSPTPGRSAGGPAEPAPAHRPPGTRDGAAASHRPWSRPAPPPTRRPAAGSSPAPAGRRSARPRGDNSRRPARPGRARPTGPGPPAPRSPAGCAARPAPPPGTACRGPGRPPTGSRRPPPAGRSPPPAPRCTAATAAPSAPPPPAPPPPARRPAHRPACYSWSDAAAGSAAVAHHPCEIPRTLPRPSL
jgi:hypothetical protein